MKKTLVTLFTISVFAGAGYLLWAKSPIGKKVLSSWLLKRWGEMAKRKNKTLDLQKLATELEKLSYADLELLTRYTFFDPMGKDDRGALRENNKKRFYKFLEQMKQSKLWQRADLSQLDNIVMPG